tara:strand:+ start:1065 stop:1364 length:300 start_codon:yes stop_codon:yes gene_type:complete
MLDFLQRILTEWKKSGYPTSFQPLLIVERHEVANYIPPKGFAHLPDWVKAFPAFILVNDAGDGTWDNWFASKFPGRKRCSYPCQELYDFVEENRANKPR